ncbi:hypothetical protein GGS21DRAFT_269308 [Xylaria nigripes]|nr:hypothetical protein GGS21DRAFT_269308 [Xylaria nigripes]
MKWERLPKFPAGSVTIWTLLTRFHQLPLTLLTCTIYHMGHEQCWRQYRMVEMKYISLRVFFRSYVRRICFQDRGKSGTNLHQECESAD